MRVKKAGGGVWSRRANLSSGSRRPAVECGLGGRKCRAGQRTCRWSVVCGEKTLRRSKVKNAPTVKESAPPSLRRRLGGALLIKSSIVQGLSMCYTAVDLLSNHDKSINCHIDTRCSSQASADNKVNVHENVTHDERAPFEKR